MYRILSWLEEVAIASKVGQNGPEVDTHIEAFRELKSNFHNMTGRQFVETMTTAQFELYFADALSRQFYADYAYKIGSWPAYVAMDRAPDFREVKRFRMSMPGTLYRRGEKGEAEATHIDDSEVNYSVDEFARQMDFSWRTIVNDDLAEIRRQPQRMAQRAGMWLNEYVSALYDNATTQATLAALGAPWAGTGRLTALNLAIGINGMYQRTDALGNPIQFSTLHLVIPPMLQMQSASILQDLINYGGANSNVLSQFLSGNNVHVDPYITFVGANVPWYLFADKSDAPAVTLARLTGMDGPVVYKKASDIQVLLGTAPAAMAMGDYATGDIEMTVEDIIGGWDDASYVGVTDFRALFYSSGTTP